MRSRNDALEALLDELCCISDKEYQRRVWVRAEGPECDDFDETVCRYFDAIEAVFKRSYDWDLSDSQLCVLKKFHHQFIAFADDNDWPPLFIDTPEWTKITEMAKDVLKAFNHPRSDNSLP